MTITLKVPGKTTEKFNHPWRNTVHLKVKYMCIFCTLKNPKPSTSFMITTKARKQRLGEKNQSQPPEEI